MSLGWLILEVESLDEFDFLGRVKEVVFGNSLGEQLNVVVDAQDSLIPWQFLIDFVAMNFVQSNRPGLGLVI